MGSAAIVSSSPSPAFLAAFQQAADGSGRLSFEHFMQLALYHPQVGYYRQPRARVGYGGTTDFFTASSSGAVFGELVAAAARQLIERQGAAVSAYTFVEIGAETAEGILAGVAHPFAAVRTLRLGEPLSLSGRCVVFSNELFDAQPVARYVGTGEGWAEVYVERVGNALREVLVPPASSPDRLPEAAPAGYHFDAPFAATTLAAALAAQPWDGLFLAFDYGKPWAELATETPGGTTRAYFRHAQSNDLLARPGEQDLTCHICWDWLAEALSAHRFVVDPIVAQETFLVTQAGARLAELMARDAQHLNQRKLSLLQLLHPSHLGRKFQVLSAWRCPG